MLFYSPSFFVDLLAIWALSRYRGHVADRGAVTGAPEQLMSALQTTTGRSARGDLRGGLAVQALCIVGRWKGWRRFELFSEQLAELSRELRKAA